ncbi:hypothetical protein RUM44_010458 [Polyplax serrata]|uniref:Uncharacterized protein n=1 Tax=Polyplax serrata TaxID=468196 RepID=A0ABR1AVN2_POLSC
MKSVKLIGFFTHASPDPHGENTPAKGMLIILTTYAKIVLVNDSQKDSETMKVQGFRAGTTNLLLSKVHTCSKLDN